MKNRKLNNKGVTLIELIVSFSIVAVAVIYFYQMLTSVTKMYAKAKEGVNHSARVNYAFRIIDAADISANEEINCDSGKYFEDLLGDNGEKISDSDDDYTEEYTYRNSTVCQKISDPLGEIIENCQLEYKVITPTDITPKMYNYNFWIDGKKYSIFRNSKCIE